MASSVTLLADHKGYTTPRVSGDEYYVDVLIDMGAYETGGIDVTAAQCGLSTVTQVMVTGQDSTVGIIVAEVSATGTYASGTAFVLNVLHENSNQIAEHNSTTDYGSVRARVYGQL